MRWYHRIGIKAVDLLIITLVLFFVVTQTTLTEGWTLLSIDILSLIAVVFGTYVGVVVFVEILLMAFSGDGAFQSFAKGAIGGLLVYFLFPYIVNILMWLLGYTINADVQMLLMISAMARMVIRIMLSRHWEVVP